MTQPFIRNHQYNFIKKQAGILQQALRSANDLKVLESVKYSVQTNISELFPAADESQRKLLEGVAELATTEDFAKYAQSLESYLIPFPEAVS
jgi:hypothetical protein